MYRTDDKRREGDDGGTLKADGDNVRNDNSVLRITIARIIVIRFIST